MPIRLSLIHICKEVVQPNPGKQFIGRHVLLVIVGERNGDQEDVYKRQAFCSMLYRPIATVQSDETPEFRIIFATTKSVHGVRKELIMRCV